MTITPSELAKRAGVRRQMIFNYLAAGRIVGEHTPDRWRIEEEEAERWLTERNNRLKAKQDKIKRQLRGVTPF
jgi:predicted site-specific integrase-resolvase